jgi:hypothetical protein
MHEYAICVLRVDALFRRRFKSDMILLAPVVTRAKDGMFLHMRRCHHKEADLLADALLRRQQLDTADRPVHAGEYKPPFRLSPVDASGFRCVWQKP